LSSLFAPAL